MKLIDFHEADAAALRIAREAANEFWTRTSVRFSVAEFEMQVSIVAGVAIRHLDATVGPCKRRAYDKV